MNILIITPTVFRYPIKSYAGIEYLCQELAVGLVKRGHKVDLVAPRGSKIEGVNVIETVYLNSNDNLEYVQFSILKDFPLGNYDVIHDNTHGCYMYLHEDVNKLPLIWTLHDPPHFKTKPPVKYMRLVAISKRQQSLLSKLGFSSKLVYNGVKLDNYRYNEEKLNRLLYFSRFSQEKGAHIAIDIAHRLRMPIDVAGGIYVRSKGYLEHIKRVCEKIPEATYWGEVSNELRTELLSRAKCLVFPILHEEPFGLVVLEAMASGTPPIVRNRGPMSEFVKHGENGYLCETDDDILKAVGQVDEIEKRKCLETAQRFSSDVMIENYIKLYEEVMDGEAW